MLSSMHVQLPRSSSKQKKKELLQRLEKVWNKQENQYCIDCDEKNTSWASILAPVLGASKKMAVFLCYKCCNYHMTLGRNICLVKNLKTANDWTEEEIRVLEAAGNDIANVIYEGKLNIQKPSPADHDAQQMFIYAKYKRLDFLCQKTYEGHHGMWLSSVYKETVNTMNQMAETSIFTSTKSSDTKSSKSSDTKSSIFSSSKSSAAKGSVEFGPELPEAAKCGPESQSDTSTALTESESTIGEEHVVNNWEKDAMARAAKAKEEKEEAEAAKMECSDSVKNDASESDLDPNQRAKTAEEAYVMNQRLQNRLAGRRSSAISGRRRASVSALDAGSMHRAVGARRERKSDPNMVGLPDESKDSAKNMEGDESKATEELPDGEPTTTSEKNSSANNLLDHSKSPATRRMNRRAGRRSTICTGSNGALANDDAGQIKRRSAPCLQELSKSPSSRRITRRASNRKMLGPGPGDLDESPTKERRSRPRKSMRAPGEEPRPRKSMSRRSLSMDDTPDLVKAKDGDGEKAKPRARRGGSRRSITMNCTPEELAELKDAAKRGGNDKEETNKEGDGAEEKPKPRPRRGMSRRSISMDCTPEQVAEVIKKEAKKGKDGAEEKAKPRPRKALSRRSMSMEGSMQGLSLNGASSHGKNRRTRKSSLNKSKSFDATTIKKRGFADEVDIDTDIDTDLDLSISDASLGDSKTCRNSMSETGNKSLVLKGVSLLASLNPKEKNGMEDMVDTSGCSNKDNPSLGKSRAELRAAVSILSSQVADPTVATYYKSVSNLQMENYKSISNLKAEE